MLSFVAALLLLIGLIAAGNFFFRPKTQETETAEPVKEVSVYRIGEAPTMTLQAQIEKSGSLKIVALTPGIVQDINVSAGEPVQKGANLIQLAANYSGGNPAAVQTAIAAKQYQLAKETFDTQKELITKQREVANKTDANADEMRRISEQSIEDTRANINLVQQNMDRIVEAVDALEAIPTPTTAQEEQIGLLRAQQSQLQSALIQARSGLRNLEYSTNSGNPPSQLADLQREITLKQLDIQERSLQIQKEVSALQVALAQINAENYHPTAPFAGTVDRIYVKEGEQVNPGTPLLSLVGDETTLTAIVKLPGSIAATISRTEPTEFIIDGVTVSLTPSYVSKDSTDGQLYSAIYTFPDGYAADITSGSYITAIVPIGNPDTTASLPFIPLDSVYQTQNESLVYLVEGENAKAKPVRLGEVIGGFVVVTEGLNSGDQVITNRNIVEGDKISIKNLESRI